MKSVESVSVESVSVKSVKSVFESVSSRSVQSAIAAATFLVILVACGGNPRPLDPTPVAPSPAGPDSFDVELETTAGPVVIRSHRAWAPLAADRFHDLVRRGVYNDIRIFRVVPNYVAQWGLSGDSAVNAAWRNAGLEDEPVITANLRGRVAFARGGPRTRSLQVFVNLRDNSPRLDTLVAGGVAGYPPFGEVISGMDVVDRFHQGYGGEPSRFQDSIAVQGNLFLDRVYPDLTRILRARITRSWK